MFIHGSRIRTSVIGCIYKKTFRLSTLSRQQSEIGTFTNMVAVNADMLASLVFYLNYMWSAPLQIIISLIILWYNLGISTLAGFITLVLLIPLSVIVGNRIKKLQLIKHHFMDDRIKTMNEILSGIKVIKFYGWELSFSDLIEKVRSKELDYLKKIEAFSIVNKFLWNISPLLVTIVSFGFFILLNGGEKFTPNVVFVSISLFNIMRFPLSIIPTIISSLISVSNNIIEIYLYN